MVNTLAPYGAALYQNEGKQFRVRRYAKVSTNVINENDFVIQDTSGAVDLASTSGPYLGAAAEWVPAGSIGPIAIVDDPEAVFSIQANDVVQQASVFMNASISYAAGSTSLKVSKSALNVASIATTATLPLKIIGLADDVGNAYGSFPKLLVKINNHPFKGGTGTVGV